jgi:hypothetical protein
MPNKFQADSLDHTLPKYDSNEDKRSTWIDIHNFSSKLTY